MASALAIDATVANAVAQLGGTRATPPAGNAKNLRAQAQDFEAVFINAMFQQMYVGLDGEGPMGNSPGVGVWRSMLTDEYAKSFAKSGGIGLADHVYRALLARQEKAA